MYHGLYIPAYVLVGCRFRFDRNTAALAIYTSSSKGFCINTQRDSLIVYKQKDNEAFTLVVDNFGTKHVNKDNDVMEFMIHQAIISNPGTTNSTFPTTASLLALKKV